MEIREILIFIASCILSYILGGISVARMITKKSKNDISASGSGNPGTMNMLRTRGLAMGLFTLLCDALKGAIPALFGYLYFGHFANSQMAYIALYSFGLCAVLGHIFPIFSKFKGGKGIATTFGLFMIADPICTVILFGILFLTLYFIKIGSLVSLLFITIEAIVQLFRNVMDGNWIAKIIMWVIVIIDVWCHRQNILRLIENRENPADLQEGLKKDIAKIQNKREKKLEKNAIKMDKLENKFNKKIVKKETKINNKIEKINQKQYKIAHDNKISKVTSKKDKTNNINDGLNNQNEQDSH